jgi:hypothetical protein
VRKWLCWLAGAALSAASVFPSVANASTVIDIVTQDGGWINAGSGTPSISGACVACGALTPANDWVEFFLVPANSSGITSVNGLGYSGETWEITTSNISDVVYGPNPDSGTTFGVFLTAGQDYFLRFTGTPSPGSSTVSSFEITLTPLPGTLALFVGGLGLLGFAGFRSKRRITQRLGLTSIGAA